MASLKNVIAKRLGENKLGTASAMLGAGIGVHEYMQNRNEGDSRVGAATKAIGETVVAGAIGPGKYVAGLFLVQTPKAATNAFNSLNIQARELERMGYASPFSNGHFVDNPQLYTMRQASMAMIEQAKYAQEHAMQGNEAQYFHR